MISEESKRMLSECVFHPIRSLYRFLWLLNTKDPAFANREAFFRLRNAVLSLPDGESRKYKDEIAFLQSCPLSYFEEQHLFPYERVAEPRTVGAFFDSERKLPYVNHNGARLYFPRRFSVDDATRLYRYYVEEEGLLGTGLLRKSPHRYTTPDFRVENGETVIDIGCSEALFSLDNLAVAKEVYLFETLKEWKEPLKATFAERLGTSVFVHNKFVGEKTGGHNIRLLDAVKQNNDARYFIKMDIEGGERVVLHSCRDFLMAHKVKICCCLYHRPDDELVIVSKLREMGFSTEISDGYVFIPMNGIHFPYFRRCLVRAKNY